MAGGAFELFGNGDVRMTTTTGWKVIIPFLRPLEPYIKDPAVMEIMVNNRAVFIERAGLLE